MISLRDGFFVLLNHFFTVCAVNVQTCLIGYVKSAKKSFIYALRLINPVHW